MLDIRFRVDEAKHVIRLGDFEFPREFACKCGCGLCDVAFNLWWALQLLRMECGTPLIINRACSCEAHNQSVGGAPASHHLAKPTCKAADIKMPGYTPDDIAIRAWELKTLVKRVGIYMPGPVWGEGFVHIDVGIALPGEWIAWRYGSGGNLIESR